MFQLNAGPVARIDYRPRRNPRQVLRKIGIRVALVVMLAGAAAVAVHESVATGPLAWQWIQHTLLSQSSHTTVAVTPPVVEQPKPAAGSEPATAASPAIVAPALAYVAPRFEATVAAAKLSPTAPEADPVDPSPEQTIRDLWNQGLAAESQRRFAVAADRYEQIMSYPDTYWPATLKTRLGLVRQETGGTR